VFRLFELCLTPIPFREPPGAILAALPGYLALATVLDFARMNRLASFEDEAKIAPSTPAHRVPKPKAEVDPSASFLCMRLMCSQNKAEVEAVKKELLNAGIGSETRKHALAESFGINALELWVQDERNFFDASNVMARMQISPWPTLEASCDKPQNESLPGPIALRAERGDQDKLQELGPADSTQVGKIKPEALAQTSSLLQKEIEEMLQCESELSTECVSLRSKLQELEQALADSRTVLRRETENQAALQTKQAQQISALRSAFEGERTQRAAAEKLLERERFEHKRVAQQLVQDREQSQQQLKSADVALQDVLNKLETKAQLLRSQETTVLKLKKDMVSLERQRDEGEQSLAKANAELVLAREARTAAEDRAESAEGAQKCLEHQLLELMQMQQVLQAHWNNLNSLYSKVHTTRAGRPAI
jgi:hypothetical protein